MKVTRESLTAQDGTTVHFVRAVIGIVTATLVRATWTTAPRGATWASFGAFAWTLPASTIASLREALALPDDIRIGIATPATEAEVAEMLRLMANHPGERFTRTGEVTLTFGCDADGAARIRDGWANARLILTGEEAGWVPVASATATTATTLALAGR